MQDIMTKHAEARRLNRSIRFEDCQAFQEWADLEVPARDNALHVQMSSKAAALAIGAGIRPEQIARLRRITWVIRGGRVVTMYRRCPKKPDARGEKRQSFKAWGR
jgi:hypothetical protein